MGHRYKEVDRCCSEKFFFEREREEKRERKRRKREKVRELRGHGKYYGHQQINGKKNKKIKSSRSGEKSSVGTLMVRDTCYGRKK